MKPDLRYACLALLPLALAACQGEKEPGAAQAEGEILPGSVSDAMLPLDTVRSQPPLAPRPTASGTKDDSSSGDADADAAPADGAGAGGEASATEPAAATPSER